MKARQLYHAKRRKIHALRVSRRAARSRGFVHVMYKSFRAARHFLRRGIIFSALNCFLQNRVCVWCLRIFPVQICKSLKVSAPWKHPCGISCYCLFLLWDSSDLSFFSALLYEICKDSKTVAAVTAKIAPRSKV